MLTTTSITTVSVSTRIAQSTSSVPESNHVQRRIVSTVVCPTATSKNATQDSTAATTMKAQVSTSQVRAPAT